MENWFSFRAIAFTLTAAGLALLPLAAEEAFAAKKPPTPAHKSHKPAKPKAQKVKQKAPPPNVSPEALAKVVKKTEADLDRNLAISLQRGMLHELLPLFKQIADRVGGLTEWDLAATCYRESKLGFVTRPQAPHAKKTKNYLQNDPSALPSQAKEHKDAILDLLAKGPLIFKGVDYARRSGKGEKTPMDRLVETLNALEKCKGNPSGPAFAKAQENIARVPVYAILIGAYHHKAYLDRAADKLKDKTLAKLFEEEGFYMGWNVGSGIEGMAEEAGKPASHFISDKKIHILGGSSADTNKQLFEKAATAHSVLKNEIKVAVEGIKDAGPSTPKHVVSYAPMPTLRGKLKPSAYLAMRYLDFNCTL